MIISTEDQFLQLSNACTNYRDRFLVYLLFETGLRIGQALALRHEDIIAWSNEIHIKYRTNNLNQVRNKTYKPTDDYRHLIDSVYCGYFITDDRKLTKAAPFISSDDHKKGKLIADYSTT